MKSVRCLSARCTKSTEFGRWQHSSHWMLERSDRFQSLLLILYVMVFNSLHNWVNYFSAMCQLVAENPSHRYLHVVILPFW